MFGDFRCLQRLRENHVDTNLSSPGLSNDAGFRDKGFTKRDQRDMQRLGKPQEMMRNFRTLSAVSFTVMIQATWEFSLLSSYQTLMDGGLAGTFWSYCFTSVGLFFIILCLAEMASMSPTSGGQHHWVSEFAPPQYQRVLSYITGWMATVSWQAGSASGTFLTGTAIQALISVNNDSYVPKTWQGTLLVFAMVLVCYIANIWGARYLPLLQNLLLLLHIFGFFAVMIVIWVMCPRNTAEPVFTEFSSTSGWSSMALSVIISQNTAVFGLSGTDAAAHMAEEIKDASRNVPIAMLYSYLLNSGIALVLITTFLFGVTSIEAALNDDSGFPFIWLLRQAVSTTGVNVLVAIILVLSTASNVVFNASTSRQTFAFARDRGMPLARWLGTVDPGTHVPANAVLTTALVSCGLSLANIGSPAAFNAIVSLQVSALMFSYVVSISCVLWRRLTLPASLPAGAWSLGRYGVAVNVLGLFYAAFAFFFSFWPSSIADRTAGFNWAVVPFGLLLVAAMGNYCVRRASLAYKGPVLQIEGRRFSVAR